MCCETWGNLDGNFRSVQQKKVLTKKKLPFLWGSFSLHNLHISLGILGKFHHEPKTMQNSTVSSQQQKTRASSICVAVVNFCGLRQTCVVFLSCKKIKLNIFEKMSRLSYSKINTLHCFQLIHIMRDRLYKVFRLKRM